MVGDDLYVVYNETTGSSTLTDHIRTKRYDVDNVQIGSTITVDSVSSSSPTYGLWWATIAAAEDGSFVVAWTRSTEDVPSEILFHLLAQRYESNGDAIGSEHALDPVHGTMLGLASESDAEGNIIVSWHNSVWLEPEETGIATVTIDPVGDLGSVFLLEDTPGFADGFVFSLNDLDSTFSGSAVHVLEDGRFFVVYTQEELNPSYYPVIRKVVGRYFDAVGEPLGDFFDVTTSPTYLDSLPAVAGNGKGLLLVAWNDEPKLSEPETEYVSRDQRESAVIARFIGPQASPAYSVDSDSVGFKPLSIYTRPISVEVATGHVVFHTDRGPDGQGDGILPVYRQTSDVHPIVSVDYVLPTGQTLPDLLEVKLTFGGIENTQPVFYSLSGVQPGQVVRLVLQADDVSALTTGRYNYQVEVIEHRGEEESDPKLLTGAADTWGAGSITVPSLTA